MDRRLHQGSLEMASDPARFAVELECAFEGGEHSCVWKRPNPKNRIRSVLVLSPTLLALPIEQQLRKCWVSTPGLHESIQVTLNILGNSLLFKSWVGIEYHPAKSARQELFT